MTNFSCSFKCNIGKNVSQSFLRVKENSIAISRFEQVEMSTANYFLHGTHTAAKAAPITKSKTDHQLPIQITRRNAGVPRRSRREPRHELFRNPGSRQEHWLWWRGGKMQGGNPAHPRSRIKRRDELFAKRFESIHRTSQQLSSTSPTQPRSRISPTQRWWWLPTTEPIPLSTPTSPRPRSRRGKATGGEGSGCPGSPVDGGRHGHHRPARPPPYPPAARRHRRRHVRHGRRPQRHGDHSLLTLPPQRRSHDAEEDETRGGDGIVGRRGAAAEARDLGGALVAGLSPSVCTRAATGRLPSGRRGRLLECVVKHILFYFLSSSM